MGARDSRGAGSMKAGPFEIFLSSLPALTFDEGFRLLRELKELQESDITDSDDSLSPLQIAEVRKRLTAQLLLWEVRQANAQWDAMTPEEQAAYTKKKR